MFYTVLYVGLIIIGLVIFIGLGLYILVFSSEWKKSKKPNLDSQFEKERAKDYPPAFPNGWFNLCASNEVAKGKVIEINAFNEKLAVFRTQSGKISVIDAYCPHLGANLTDGCVKGERLICPFHGWQFNTTGACVKIPYSEEGENIHHKTNKKWIIKENWGLIMVWYHSNNELPTWEPEGYLPQLNDYKFYGSKKQVLNIHLQDFFENGADFAHFSVVHKFLTIPFVNKWVHIKHKTDIRFGEGNESHMAFFYDAPEIIKTKDNTVVEGSEGRGDVTYFGAGILAFVFKTNIADPIIIKTFTPIGNLKVRMSDYIYAPKGSFKLGVKLVVKEASAQFNDDIKIWERKKFLTKPMLVQGDGPIMNMRKWYQQFYEKQNYE